VIAFAATAAAIVLFGVFEEAFARVGGGQSYSGGRGSSSNGGGGGSGGVIYLLFRALFWLTIAHPIIGIPVDIIILALVIGYFRSGNKPDPSTCSADAAGLTPAVITEASSSAGQINANQSFNQLRRFDPNFSEITFTDFCYALYGKAQNARGRRDALDLLSPYLSDQARAALQQRNPANLLQVAGVIVGAMRVADVQGLASPMVEISVDFESNYTEITGQRGGAEEQRSYYVRERWVLERKRDVLSPTPEQAVALHCPRCGAALQKDTQGACAFCGARVESGEFQWFVRSITLLGRDERGPLLTSDVPEIGTDYPTIVQPGFPNVRAAFEQSNPSFSWGDFQNRARLIFNELQAAWSTLNWERARPHETDSIFQMHQFWIEAYKRQGLRNLLDQCQITAMQPVKVKEDAFYNAITLRIFAQGFDYTVDQQGRIVSGSKDRQRRWSEYWTFIRNRNAKPAASRADLSCPNCGAQLKVNATGICEFCGGKITSGEFDWVLSKIEQDESYAG
jgi:predicted lipid-binding transport protein (Tim44 family)